MRSRNKEIKACRVETDSRCLMMEGMKRGTEEILEEELDENVLEVKRGSGRRMSLKE